jgi:SAM-dependent methyltransferase
MTSDAVDRQRQVNVANATFWEELCGTTMARQLGITAHSTASLQRFDQHYFAFYPYLQRHIPFGSLRGLDILEVGLGFGSVAQRITENGANYTGLDIATGPVNAVRQRFRLAGLSGAAVRGNILNPPFPDETFDRIVAIGCYHHTGNLQRALDETWRLLRPGGHATIMVYNAFSYRRWLQAPIALATQFFGGAGRAASSAQHARGTYDQDSLGRSAPETAFVSRSELRRMTKRFAQFRAELENAAVPFLDSLRPLACHTLGRVWGLDIYLTLTR